MAEQLFVPQAFPTSQAGAIHRLRLKHPNNRTLTVLERRLNPTDVRSRLDQTELALLRGDGNGL